MYCDEALFDICRRHLGIESPTLVILDRLLAKIFSSVMAALRLHRALKVTILAPTMSSLTASPQTASNLYDDEAPHNICCMNRPAAKITMSIFEPAAILVTSSPPYSKKMLSPSASLRILICVALVSSSRRIGGTSG